MRKLLTAVCVGALTGTAMLAGASGSADNRPETRAYFNLGFGGASQLPSNFHYGLRLDQDRRYAPANAPAVMQFDMSGSGMLNARLNGVKLLQRNLSANQEEGAAVATTTWSAADWGLIILGVAGVGYAGYEVSTSHKDSGSTTTTGSSTGGNTTGGNTTGGLLGTGLLGTSTGGSTTGGSTTGGSTTGGGLLGTGLLGFAEVDAPSQVTRQSPEYQEWLDGGTGHMGDLEPAR